MEILASFACAIAAVLAVYVLFRSRVGQQRLPLPPGPKGLPIIGNLFDMPRTYMWIHLAKYKELYGPIASLSILGRHFIIVSDHKTAVELLEKRGLIYSDRVNTPMARLSGMVHFTTMLPYGTDLATHRRLLHRFIGSKEALVQLQPIQELETRRFILRIMTQPDMLYENIRTLSGSIILKLAYGYAVDTTKSDPLLTLTNEALRLGGLVLQPGKWLVDLLPLVQHLPDWMSGESRRMVSMCRACFKELVDRPHTYVKAQMAKGDAKYSFNSYFMESELGSEEESNIKWSAATLYAAGADTTGSVIYAFFLVMQLYPEVQKKAQSEIDSIIGPDRMPTLADRQNLPYVEALVKELLRWNVALPFGLPHVSRENDTYEGYFIPKDSVIMFNVWAISRDANAYCDPALFNPERFLSSKVNKQEMNPQDTVFGYGRRICPGKGMAMATIFIAVAMTLATLDIQKVKDENGREIVPEYELTDTLVTYTKPFPCLIVPRTAKAMGLIHTIEEEKLNATGDADALRDVTIQD